MEHHHLSLAPQAHLLSLFSREDDADCMYLLTNSPGARKIPFSSFKVFAQKYVFTVQYSIAPIRLQVFRDK
jgi:hypothetical protein